MSSPSSLVMPLPVVMLVHGSLYMPILLVYDHQDGTNLGLQMRFFFFDVVMSASGFKMGCFPDLDPPVWPREQAQPLPPI